MSQKNYLENERILIVDDHQKWLDVAQQNAEYYGAKNISCALTIEEGKRLYNQLYPTIIMQDINFDDQDPLNKDGLEFIKELRKKGNSQKIIAMTSFRGLKGLAKKAGADYFVRKKEFVKDFDGFIEAYPNKK